MKDFVPEYIVQTVLNSTRVKNYINELKHGKNPIDFADLNALVRIALQEGAFYIVEANESGNP